VSTIVRVNQAPTRPPDAVLAGFVKIILTSGLSSEP
jgi:hypothetical protein